jgi:cysteine-rich repeat protein
MFYVDDLRISSLFVEECDDGNNEPGDGCDPDCFLE